MGQRSRFYACPYLLHNEAVQKARTSFLSPFSIYFGYAFAPLKSFAWTVARFMSSSFVSVRRAFQKEAFCTASTFRLSGALLRPL